MLAKIWKSIVYLGVNEHFESELNDKAALLDSFRFFVNSCKLRKTIFELCSFLYIFAPPKANRLKFNQLYN